MKKKTVYFIGIMSVLMILALLFPWPVTVCYALIGGWTSGGWIQRYLDRRFPDGS